MPSAARSSAAMSMRFICIMGVEGPLCPGAIGVADQPDKLAGNDLPRHAEAVFHPAALLSLGDRRECIGESIGLGLGLHQYLERDRLIEF